MKKKNIKIIILSTIIIVLLIIVFNIGNKDLIVTYCDESYNCNIDYMNSKVDSAFNKYKKYNYVKVDEIINEKVIDLVDLKGLIIGSNKNQFSKGLNINNKIRLLSEEINVNNIIDRDNMKINISNNYLTAKNVSITEDDLNYIKSFDTNSYYKSNKMKDKIKLQNVNGYNIKDYSQDDIKNIIDNSANKLLDMQQDSGRFIYEYRASTGEINNTYNILRHAGTVYSLIKYYEVNNDQYLKEKIEKSINYLLDNYIKKYSKNTLLVYEKKSNEFKLGGNALTLLMLSEYQMAFNDNKYYETATKIANGIKLFQKEDGSLIHVLNQSYKLKEEFRSSYYDGEAAYSLLKFYELTNNKKYYKFAKKIIDKFMKKETKKIANQWIIYTFSELIKLNKNEKYIKYILNNYNNKYDDTKTFDPTIFELLTTMSNIYNYLNDKGYASDILEQFDKEQLDDLIAYNKNVLLSYYVDDTYAMYFKNGNLTKYGFCDTIENFRVRIDDIQHSLSGLINYYYLNN